MNVDYAKPRGHQIGVWNPQLLATFSCQSKPFDCKGLPTIGGLKLFHQVAHSIQQSCISISFCVCGLFQPCRQNEHFLLVIRQTVLISFWWNNCHLVLFTLWLCYQMLAWLSDYLVSLEGTRTKYPGDSYSRVYWTFFMILEYFKKRFPCA